MVRSTTFLPVDLSLTPHSVLIGIFPGRGQVTWRDWYTHDAVEAGSAGQPTKLSAPLGHINVHIRDGSAMFLHSAPGYTIEETRQGPYSLLVSLNASGRAYGTVYIDDGSSNPPGPSKTLTITVADGQVRVSVQGDFKITRKLEDLTILGVSKKPAVVTVNGAKMIEWMYVPQQAKLTVPGVGTDLNRPLTVKWD